MRIQAGAQLGQMHGRDQRVARPREQRFRGRFHAAIDDDHEHGCTPVGRTTNERAHLIGKILDPWRGRVEQQVGR